MRMHAVCREDELVAERRLLGVGLGQLRAPDELATPSASFATSMPRVIDGMP
jgi:hypothetical protein